MSGFSNSILGGQSALIRAAIKSPNFVTGISGWTINKDGSAEFNDLTIRGAFFGLDYIINSSGLFFYSGTPAAGNLVASVASVSGTDAHTNAYLDGTTTYATSGGNARATQLGSGNVNFWTAPTQAGPWTQVGSIGNGGGSSLFLNSNQYIVAETEIRPLDVTNPANPESWHYVGAGSGLGTAFGAAWGNAGGGFANLAFRKVASPAQKVEIQGTIATTGISPNNNIFTLPAGYIPANSQRFGRATAAVPAAACNIQVAGGTGVVQVSNAPGGVATTIGVDISVSLDL